MKLRFSLILVLATLGCKELVNKNTAPVVKTEFGVTIADTPIDTSLKVGGLKSQLQKLNYNFPEYDFLFLSNLFLKSSRKDLNEAGLNLSETVSIAGHTATAMTADVLPPGNPYTEQVYEFLKPVLLGQYTKLVTEAQKIVEEVAAKLPGIQGKSNTAAEYMTAIVENLKLFAANLLPDPNVAVAKFLNPVIEELNTNYISVLSNTIPKLTWNSNQRLDLYLDELKKEVVKLPGLSESEKKSSLNQIAEAYEYAKQNEDVVDSNQALQLIIDMWLNKSNRSRLSAEIVMALKLATEKQLLALSTDNQPLFDAEIWKTVKAKDVSTMNYNELVALMTNNSALFKPADYTLLNPDVLRKQILKSKTIQDLAYSQGAPMIANDQEKLRAVLSYWLALKTRFIFPEALISAFSDLEENDFANLRNYSSRELLLMREIQLAIKKWRILSAIEEFADPNIDLEKVDTPAQGVANLKRMLNRKISGRVEAVFKDKIRYMAINLKDILTKQIIEKLESKKPQFNSMAFDNFKQYAQKYLNQWFFNFRPLPLFEDTFLTADKVATGFWIISGDTTESTSVNLGGGLTNNYLLLSSGIAPSKTQSDAFRLVSRLAALSGYKDYEGKLTDSPTMSLTKGKEDERFDLRAYNPDVTVFAVPDRVFFTNSFKADLAKSRLNYNVSVLGQMELLQGYSNAMKYLKPWEKSTYDGTLSKLRIDVNKELSEQEIFIKSKNYKQSLGLAAAVLKTLRSKMIGVFDDKGNLFEGLNSLKDRRGVVVLDFNEEQMHHSIRTFDLATAILALCDFYETSADFELIGSDPDISEETKKELKDGRKQLKELLIPGLAIFATGRLMQKDGGFVEGLNLDTKKGLSSQRLLEDQLIMQKALLRAAKVVESNFLKAKAFDNFFFLNGHFWNPKLGFYNLTEKESSVIYLKHVALVLENLNEMLGLEKSITDRNPYLNPSLNQMKVLKGYLNQGHLSALTLAQRGADLVLPQIVLSKAQ